MQLVGGEPRCIFHIGYKGSGMCSTLLSLPGQGIENRSLKGLGRETSGTLGTGLVALSFWKPLTSEFGEGLQRVGHVKCHCYLGPIGWHSTARSESLGAWQDL